MKMQHLIIEGFCEGSEKQNTYPCLCNGEYNFGIYCFECSGFRFTYCPNEIALSDAEEYDEFLKQIDRESVYMEDNK